MLRANRRALLLSALLAAVTLVLLWPVRQNAFLDQYDDQDYVTANPQVQGGLNPSGLAWAFRTGHAANWHPVTWLSHMLDVELFGMRPAGHHLTNLLLHASNAALLLLLLYQMTGGLWRSSLVAALFALHPLHVESVAWVAERKDVLSTFFGLLSIWSYATYARRSGMAADSIRTTAPPAAASNASAHRFGVVHRVQRSSLVWYSLSLLLFALSLMSKPMLVTLPFLLLLLDLWPLNRFNLKAAGIQRRTLALPLLEKLPYLAVTTISCVITLSVQQPAMAYQRELAFPARAANAFVSCARYLAGTFWPQDLAVYYPHPGHWPVGGIAGAVLLVLLISAVAVSNARRRPYLLVGWLWFIGLLVPVLGFVQVGVQAMADRYTYLPLVGVLIAVVWGSASRLRLSRLVAGFAAAVSVTVLALCLMLTRKQLQYWRDAETLFNHAVAVTSDNWVAHNNLALLALRHYQDTQRAAVQQQIANPASQSSHAVQTDSSRRDYLQEIIEHCELTIRVKPAYPDPYVTLAKALAEKGRLDDAKQHLTIAIRLDPKNPEARQQLAEILYRQGQPREAINEYRAALELKPDWPEVLNNLAWLLATQPEPAIQNGPEAVRLSERACNLSGRTNFWFLQTLAAAQAACGNFEQAVVTADSSRQLAAVSGQTNLAVIADSRLQLYRSRQPYRDR